MIANYVRSFHIFIKISYQHLADNYRLGYDCNHIRPKLYTYEIESHSIYYSTMKDGIMIVWVLHKSMKKKLHF